MASLLSKALGLCVLLVGLFPRTAAALPWDIDMVDGYFYRAYEWSMMGLPEGIVARNPDSIYVAGVSGAGGTWANNATIGGHFLDDLNATTVCSNDRLRVEMDMARDDANRDEARDDDTKELIKGKNLFGVYCAACHGQEGRGGAAVSQNDDGRRYSLDIPVLSGGCEANPTVDYEANGYFASDCQNEMSKESCEDRSCVWKGGSRVAAQSHLGCDGGLFTTIRNGTSTGTMRGYHQAMDSDDIWAVVTYLRELPGNGAPTN